MASFSLRSQRTGSYKDFTLLEILKLLGDTINDEIWLEDGEDVYNLSSFREAGSSGGNTGTGNGNWSVETPPDLYNQDTFYLKYIPASAVLMVILNGITGTENKDFTRDGRQVKLPFRLNVQDTLKFIYQF